MALPNSRPTRRVPARVMRPAIWLLAAVMLAISVLPPPAFAAGATGPSGLPLPRFVSINSDKVNVRKGPGQQYPIAWVYVRRGMPVEIIAEYDLWRQIRDHDNASGWVQKNLLSGRRTGMVSDGSQPLRRDPDPTAPAVAMLEAGVIGEVKRCKGEWCAFRVKDYSGWVRRDALWGVSATETFD